MTSPLERTIAMLLSEAGEVEARAPQLRDLSVACDARDAARSARGDARTLAAREAAERELRQAWRLRVEEEWRVRVEESLGASFVADRSEHEAARAEDAQRRVALERLCERQLAEAQVATEANGVAGGDVADRLRHATRRLETWRAWALAADGPPAAAESQEANAPAGASATAESAAFWGREAELRQRAQQAHGRRLEAAQAELETLTALSRQLAREALELEEESTSGLGAVRGLAQAEGERLVREDGTARLGAEAEAARSAALLDELQTTRVQLGSLAAEAHLREEALLAQQARACRRSELLGLQPLGARARWDAFVTHCQALSATVS